MTFDEWFSGQQGEPYYGMYSFAQAAWDTLSIQHQTQLAEEAEAHGEAMNAAHARIYELTNRLVVWESGTAADISRSMIKTADKLMKERDAIKSALSDLLFVINQDKDSGWFICEEAADIIEAARKALEEA